MLKKIPGKLASSSHPAKLWTAGEKGRVTCHLSPRNCNIPVGGLGFCGVRANENGKLVSLNYGKSVKITEETIETEAVFHYAPGSKILSLGNVGCMMHCDFCHNWSTSQARLAQDQDIYFYQPEEIVEYALRHQIPILSWTYNDPVVWHEFIMDTATLAQQYGIKNLYKSAFYISAPAVEELLEVIDIFSVSLKSMDPIFYRNITKGELQPVLDAILQVYRAKKHLEISNLAITGRNDTLEESDKIAHWMLEHLEDSIPLHYVRFHPDYKYNQVARTSVAFLEEARQSALRLGLKHVYLGNVNDTNSVNTYCDCGTLLIERYGLNTKLFLSQGACPSCQKIPAIQMLSVEKEASLSLEQIPAHFLEKTHYWEGNKISIHLTQEEEKEVYYQFLSGDSQKLGALKKSSSHRFVLSKISSDCVGVSIFYPPQHSIQLYEVYDRAHFPTSASYEFAVD